MHFHPDTLYQAQPRRGPPEPANPSLGRLNSAACTTPVAANSEAASKTILFIMISCDLTLRL
jgi:hypothetical protein